MLLGVICPLWPVILPFIHYSTFTRAAVAHCWYPDPLSIDHPPPGNKESCAILGLWGLLHLDRSKFRFLNPPRLPQPVDPPVPAAGTHVIRGTLHHTGFAGGNMGCRADVALGAMPYTEPEDLFADVLGSKIYEALHAVLETCVNETAGLKAGWITVEPDNKVHLIIRGIPDGPVGPPLAADETE